jgi:hypothetical protein
MKNLLFCYPCTLQLYKYKARKFAGQSHLKVLDTDRKTLCAPRNSVKSDSITLIAGNGESHGEICNVFGWFGWQAV